MGVSAVVLRKYAEDPHPVLKIKLTKFWDVVYPIDHSMSEIKWINNKMSEKKKYTATFADRWLLDNRFKDWLCKV